MALNKYGVIQIYAESSEWVNMFLRAKHEKINVVDIKPYILDGKEKLMVVYTEKEDYCE